MGIRCEIVRSDVVSRRFTNGSTKLRVWCDILAPLDSPTYPLVHRIVSSAFGASCTSFLPTLKSMHDT